MCFMLFFVNRVYVAALIRPYIPTVFIGAFILGTGGGGECTLYTYRYITIIMYMSVCLYILHPVLWTAQGNILIQNSSKSRMGTTSGIFWFMLESR